MSNANVFSQEKKLIQMNDGDWAKGDNDFALRRHLSPRRKAGATEAEEVS